MNDEPNKFKSTHFFMGVLPLFMLFFMIVGLFFFDIPDKSRDMLNIALGFVGGYTGAVISYYFGTTAEKNKAKEKTDE